VTYGIEATRGTLMVGPSSVRICTSDGEHQDRGTQD